MFFDIVIYKYGDASRMSVYTSVEIAFGLFEVLQQTRYENFEDEFVVQSQRRLNQSKNS